jgi:hypothetical protein
MSEVNYDYVESINKQSLVGVRPLVFEDSGNMA